MFTLDWHRLNFTSGSNNATGVRKDKSQESLMNFLLGAGNDRTPGLSAGRLLLQSQGGDWTWSVALGCVLMPLTDSCKKFLNARFCFFNFLIDHTFTRFNILNVLGDLLEKSFPDTPDTTSPPLFSSLLATNITSSLFISQRYYTHMKADRHLIVYSPSSFFNTSCSILHKFFHMLLYHLYNVWDTFHFIT